MTGCQVLREIPTVVTVATATIRDQVEEGRGETRFPGVMVTVVTVEMLREPDLGAMAVTELGPEAVAMVVLVGKAKKVVMVERVEIMAPAEMGEREGLVGLELPAARVAAEEKDLVVLQAEPEELAVQRWARMQVEMVVRAEARRETGGRPVPAG